MSQTQQSFGSDGPSNKNEEGKVPNTFKEEQHSQKHSTAPEKWDMEYLGNEYLELRGQVKGYEDIQRILQNKVDSLKMNIVEQNQRISSLEESLRKLTPLSCNIPLGQFQELQNNMRTYVQSELDKLSNTCLSPILIANKKINMDFGIDSTERKSPSILPQKQNLGNQKRKESEDSKYSTNGYENSTYNSKCIHDSSRPPIKNSFGIRGPNFWKDDPFKDITLDDLDIKGKKLRDDIKQETLKKRP